MEYLDTYQPGLKPRQNPTIIAHESFVALSLTCSQLYQESTSIFFSKNRFCFQDVFGMSVFLGNISHDQRSQITEVLFPFTHRKSDEHEWAFKLLQECRIHKLTVGIRSVCIDHYDGDVGNFFKQDEVKWLRRIRGWKEVDLKVVEICCWAPDDLDWHGAKISQTSGMDKLIFEFLRDLQVMMKSDFSQKPKGGGDGPRRQTRGMKKELEEKEKAREERWCNKELYESDVDVLGGERQSICASCKQKQAQVEED